jgi:acyl-CoA thioesterase I
LSQRLPSGGSGRGVPLPNYRSLVGQMTDAAKAAGVRVVLLAPTLVYEDLECAENQRLGQYVRAMEAVARDRQVTFIDLNRAFRESVGAYQRHAGQGRLLFTTDGVHMNDAGNALMAGTILRALGVPIKSAISPK